MTIAKMFGWLPNMDINRTSASRLTVTCSAVIVGLRAPTGLGGRVASTVNGCLLDRQQQKLDLGLL
jgi:hypothetical protein